MKNLVSIFAGHDANVSFYNAKEDKYYTIEIERLVKKRYFRLHVDNDEQTIRDILFQCRNIAATEWDITNCLLYTSPSPRDLSTSRMPSSA